MKINRRNKNLGLGDFRNIITLKPPTYTDNGRGGSTVVFNEANYIQVYAKVLPGSKERNLQQEQLTFDNIIDVYFRYISELNSDWKIEYEGKDYTIQSSANVDSVNRFWYITAYVKES